LILLKIVKMLKLNRKTQPYTKYVRILNRIVMHLNIIKSMLNQALRETPPADKI